MCKFSFTKQYAKCPVTPNDEYTQMNTVCVFVLILMGWRKTAIENNLSRYSALFCIFNDLNENNRIPIDLSYIILHDPFVVIGTFDCNRHKSCCVFLICYHITNIISSCSTSCVLSFSLEVYEHGEWNNTTLKTVFLLVKHEKFVLTQTWEISF